MFLEIKYWQSNALKILVKLMSIESTIKNAASYSSKHIPITFKLTVNDSFIKLLITKQCRTNISDCLKLSVLTNSIFNGIVANYAFSIVVDSESKLF